MTPPTTQPQPQAFPPPEPFAVEVSIPDLVPQQTLRDFAARAHLARKTPAEHLASLLATRLGGVFTITPKHS